jgi:hypothetical protein
MGISRKPLAFAILAAGAAALIAQTNSGAHPAHTVPERVTQWKRVEMPFHSTGLSASERQMVDKLVDASQLLDDIYWRQSDVAGLNLYKTTQDQPLKRLLTIMGCRWDLLDSNAAFVGNTPMPPGHELYPHDLTREQIEKYVQQHPEQKAALYNSYTVVERQGAKLVATPYHERYKQFLDPMARDLRDAAALSPDAAFAKFPADR